MTTRTLKSKSKKKQALRNNEYYNMQGILDKLYEQAKTNTRFKDLMSIITSQNNIALAFRNIKGNKGSKTKGVNQTTIKEIAKQEKADYIEETKKRMEYFQPHEIRRVEIEKENGTKRPLGIPTMEDRLIQQSIKQVLEPIAEAKFYQHSYGFRPNRSTHHAITRAQKLAFSGYHYIVSIDIKGFYDNVNHGKLLKQLWSMGICDKKLIRIIAKMLKAPIKGIGIPEKGVPQGGVLSSLLSNIVLNELDWWIASQWEEMKSQHPYKRTGDKHTALRKSSKLKEIRLVRYCDDFKIMCKDRETAWKIFKATTAWLKERLSLEINPEKSKVTNLRKNYSEFLGFKLKVKKGKEGKYTNRSHVRDKAKQKIKEKILERIKAMKKNPNNQEANRFNATVIGLQNYYKIATMISKDFSEIAHQVNQSLKSRTQTKRGRPKSATYERYYGNYHFKERYVAETLLFPIGGVKFQAGKTFSQEINNYSEAGRRQIHENVKANEKVIKHLIETMDKGQGVEYHDNRISLYVRQQGKCYVSGAKLKIGEMEVHHKKMKSQGGGDEYSNLLYVTSDIHKLIHATTDETIEKYKIQWKEMGSAQRKKLNKLRVLVGNHLLKE
jgi:group II intron reverse transcriptase/maturase